MKIFDEVDMRDQHRNGFWKGVLALALVELAVSLLVFSYLFE